MHSLVLLRYKPGERLSRRLEVGQVSVYPGEEDFMTVNLAPGRYLMACFLPKGTTSTKSTGTGPVHAALGMLEPIRVS